MGRYKRKSDRKLVFTENIMAEIKERLRKGQSKRSIAHLYGINEATLRKRLKAGTVPTSLGRFKSVFSEEMEQELADYCVEFQQMSNRLTLKDLCKLAYNYAEKNGLKHGFNKDIKMAGKDWAEGFCKRRNLSLCQLEKTSIARASGFNKIQVERFFSNLKKIYEEKNLSLSRIYPCRIFNMDETSVLTVSNELPKVFAEKVVSNEREQLITAVCCICAAGKYVPPALIFPRKKQKVKLTDRAPTGTLLLTSDSGFNSEVFIEWLDYFKKQENVTKENPALLILDNLDSIHISITAIDRCREWGLNLLSLPSHSRHKIQLLDKEVFGSLETAYSQECDNYVSHQGSINTQYQIGEPFGNAYNWVASVEKAVKSFESCGIWLYNEDVFSDKDLATIMERPIPQMPVEDHVGEEETRKIPQDTQNNNK